MIGILACAVLEHLVQRLQGVIDTVRYFGFVERLPRFFHLCTPHKAPLNSRPGGYITVRPASNNTNEDYSRHLQNNRVVEQS